MDLKYRRNFEFNKRVRDLVSKDTKKLTEKWDKIEKQRADRLSEIHHMQEKVRFSMRNLANDKLHVKRAATASIPGKYPKTSPRLSRKELENYGSIAKGKDNSHDEALSKDPSHRSHNGYAPFSRNVNVSCVNMSQRRASTPSSVPRSNYSGIPVLKDDISKRNRSESNDLYKGGTDKYVVQRFDAPRKSFSVPQSDSARRRASSPWSITQASPLTVSRDLGHTNETCLNDFSRNFSSSLPTEMYISASKRKLSKNIDKTLLSVKDLRISTNSPVVNFQHKTADNNVQLVRKLSDSSKQDRAISASRKRNDGRLRSVSVAQVINNQVSIETPRKLSGAGPKKQLIRTKSSSLPDLHDPNYSNGAIRGASMPLSSKDDKELLKDKMDDIAIQRSLP